ncbi:hypothetical protein [Paenibacillus lutimineralis]|uniref:DUF7916 domain-containing protein n=1 Tax=Paenibacillus lutimineralis TaxID=2707005 RepID=A0A3Q9I7I9_9BACL|nr:hypothetical protein [Paenibacillus lutimineralis]AZS14307.1 hypothetical protein EI981_07430 [Paenibacillus lutimineralis]
MSNVTRLINAHRTQIEAMTAKELKESILLSEGRVILAQNYVSFPTALCLGTTNAELSQAMGADMLLFNGYSLDENAKQSGLYVHEFSNLKDSSSSYYRIPDMRKLIDIPMGVYLECGDMEDISNAYSETFRKYRTPSPENIKKLLEEKAQYVILGGNPGTGVSYDAVLNAVRSTKKLVGDDMLIFAGKWEDGATEPVIGDPIKPLQFYKDYIKELIDAGTDVICMSMPGSRWGIDVDSIRELVTFTHTYKPGTLAMSFLDGTIEGSDVDTVRQCALWSKQTGADIHAIGDAGLSGMSVPENIYQLALSIKGRWKTWERMAASRR